MVATSFVGATHAARGEFSEAATLFERNVALEGDLRYERFGAPAIQSALSGAWLADVLSQLGRFDEAIGPARLAVAEAEARGVAVYGFPNAAARGLAKRAGLSPFGRMQRFGKLLLYKRRD